MRELDDRERTRLQTKLWRELGPEVSRALEDEGVSEILVNEDGRVRLRELRRPGTVCTESKLEPGQVRAIIHTVAHAEGKTVGPGACVVEANLPFHGARFTGIVEPVVEAPVFVLRKPASKVFPLTDYETQGRLTQSFAAAVRAAVAGRANILVVGGTHSGKTTFVNAMLAEVARVHPYDRLYVIEDVRELQTCSEDVTRTQTAEGVDRDSLLRAGLRMSPTRVIVGEVRGPEALTLLKAWNTGHPGGMSTVHADGAYDGLLKLEQLAAEGTGGWVPRPLVARAVDVVVFMASQRGVGPVVESVARVRGLRPDGEFDFEEEWVACEAS